MWRKSGYIKNKSGLNSKIHLAINGCGLHVKFIVVDGSHANCKEAINLIKNIDAKLVFDDRAYDTNKILSYIAKRKHIFPKRNKFEQLNYLPFSTYR